MMLMYLSVTAQVRNEKSSYVNLLYSICSLCTAQERHEGFHMRFHLISKEVCISEPIVVHVAMTSCNMITNE